MKNNPVIRFAKEEDLDEFIVLCKEHAHYGNAVFSLENNRIYKIKM